MSARSFTLRSVIYARSFYLILYFIYLHLNGEWPLRGEKGQEGVVSGVSVLSIE